MRINPINRGGSRRIAPVVPVKAEEPKEVPEVEVEEEIIDNPDDGEGEG